MSQKLPTHGFKCINTNNLTNEKVIKLLNQKITNHGYIFKVDLEYPKNYRLNIMIIPLP